MKKTVFFLTLLLTSLCARLSAQDFYLYVEASQQTTSYELDVLQKITLEGNNFVIYKQDGSIALTIAATDVNAMRFSSTPTNIADDEYLSNSQKNNKLHQTINLSGQVVDDSFKGIVIRDGKKEIQK